VLAAASLTGAFTELARELERSHEGAAVELHFAGTPQLVLQIKEGARADVFASADEANMRAVAAASACAEPPRVFARNHLAIVVAKGNPKRVARLADLASPTLMVALCAPRVPAGEYARQALRSAGVTVASVSDEPSVKAVVTKVALGEIDAGIVYATDARDARAGVDSVAVDPLHDVEAAYPIALLANGRSRDVGREFVELVLSDRGRRILLAHGFRSP
jgi:molybdate transport system substrate-binding protein